MKDANEVFDETETVHEQVKPHLRDVADWFHEHEGEMFERSEAVASITDTFDISEETATRVVAQLVSDTVDPIVQVTTNGEKYVGVAEFHEFDGAYGYIEYDDVVGKRKRVVCQQCVNDADYDKEVTHATEKSTHPESSTFKAEAGYDDLLEEVHDHYEQHDTVPSDVETGASLASGTTIGGNTSWHAGNDGSGSGLDADTLDGIESDEFTSKLEEINESFTVDDGSGTQTISSIDIIRGAMVSVNSTTNSVSAEVKAYFDDSSTDNVRVFVSDSSSKSFDFFSKDLVGPTGTKINKVELIIDGASGTTGTAEVRGTRIIG